MRLIHVDKVRGEGLTFTDAGFIVDVSGAEFDAVRIDDSKIYTRYAVYYVNAAQMIDQVAMARRIDSKENEYRREALYRTSNEDFFKMTEQVNVSGPAISAISYEQVVEWYQLDVPGPIGIWPDGTRGSVFGAPRFHAPGVGSAIVVGRRPGQTFVVNAYPLQADLVIFSDGGRAIDDVKFIGWCTRQEFVSRHEQIDLGYGVVRAIRDQDLNDMRDLPIPTRGNLFH
jgi:hypothetical protein